METRQNESRRCLNTAVYVVYVALSVPALTAVQHGRWALFAVLLGAAVAVTVLEHLLTKGSERRRDQ